MSCERFRTMLGDAASGASSPELVSHLSGCEACRAALAGERALLDRIDAELQDSMATEPSPAFLPGVEKEGIEMARTAALATLACSQLFHAFNCRNMQISLFKLGVFTNAKLVVAALGSFVLQLAIIYVPFLQPVFKTRSLSLTDLGVIIVFSSLPFWIMEAVKALNRRFGFYEIRA